MGNDNGVKAAVEAAFDFSKSHSEYKIILVGDQDEITKFSQESEKISIVDVKKTVSKDEGARAARNGESSMAVAINLVKDGTADAVISSGESGAYLSIATLTLRRIPGVKRPAFMPVFPTIVKGKRFVMMDCGANLETTGEMLAQWAELGNVFSSTVLKVNKPKVGLVNIGTEDSKGKEFHQEAHAVLKANKDINYVGFVETRDLLNAAVDVAIIDGYAGNMVLKTMEGTVLSLLKLIKTSLMSRLKYKIGALLAKGAFNQVKETLDYRNVGAAWIIGLNGLAIKCHGGADKKSYLGALNQVKEALDNDALKNFKEAVKIDEQ